MSEIPYLPDYQKIRSSKERDSSQQEFLIKEIGGNSFAIALTLNLQMRASLIWHLTEEKRSLAG